MRRFSILLFVMLMFTASNAAAIGLLIPKSNERPFDIVSHRAKVAITNTAAVTTVEQVFRNHTDRPLEAQFVFPIPDGGTVSNFSLWINGKKTPGAVLEKDEARKIYESIVRRTEDPGLIEYMDGKLFKTSLFPIPAKGTQKMEIQFGQVLEKTGDMYRYTYPLKAGERYVTAKTEKDFTLTGSISSGIPVRNVYSPSHQLGVSKKSENRAVFGTESVRQNLERDFELYVSFSKKDIGISLMTHDPDGDGGERGYFMVALSPKVETSAHEEIGQTVTFVMDTSGSMAGPKIEQARSTLAYCIKKLRPQDHFNVIRFSTDVEKLHAKPVKATANAKKAALSFTRELSAAGGTAISEALKEAVSQNTVGYQPHQVIFVTDGQPTVGTTASGEILTIVQKNLKKNTRIFTFGVGFDINTILLDALATKTRGRPDYVKPNDKLERSVAALYNRISAPVMSDIKLDFGETRVYDMYPNPMPDLFKGDQIVVFGRNKDPFVSAITVTGRVGKEKRTIKFGGSKTAKKKTKLDTISTEPLEFLPKLWATRKVGFLLDNIRINGESPELKNEVIRLGKKFGLVTPYTSYLAVDDSEFEQQERVRLNAPRGDLRPMEGASDGDEEDAAPVAKNSGRKFFGKGKGKRKSASKPKKKKKDMVSPMLDSIDAYGNDGWAARSGEGAVATSEANRNYREKSEVGKQTRLKRRYISSRTFEFHKNTWWQEGTKKQKTHVIEIYSKAFFKLLKKHPELKKITSELGNRVVVKLGKRVYKIIPKTK